MSFFPSLPGDAGVRHILALNPAAGRALIEFHGAALRADSQLTARDKELIAAYVSGLNACQYCYGVHKETAKAYGVPEPLIEALLADLDAAPIDARLRPILAYAKVLTLTPTRALQRHVDDVFAAGWTERDLHDAILTVCLFNFMNRLLEGHGVKGSADLYQARGQALQATGYAPLLGLLPSEDAEHPDGRLRSPAGHRHVSNGDGRRSLLLEPRGPCPGLHLRRSGAAHDCFPRRFRCASHDAPAHPACRIARKLLRHGSDRFQLLQQGRHQLGHRRMDVHGA